MDSSIITLQKKALKNNISFLRKKIANKVKISAVVKANAYGHGIEQIVPLFEDEGIDHFSVFDYTEAYRVFMSLKNQQTIMIMGWIPENKVRDAIKNDFEFYVFNLERLNTAIKEAKRLNKKAKIHLEVETGMNRSGLNDVELIKSIEIVKNNASYIEVKGCCTHLAGAESISNHFRIQKQIKNYLKKLAVLKENHITPKYRHIANSAAALTYPTTRLDLVRIGIALYGFWPSPETFIHYIANKKNKLDPLDRILGWKSKIMSVKAVTTGEFVGYGLSYLAQSDIKLALIPVGYANGYNRHLSNKGHILIHGQRCNIVGLVNMNMIKADITNIEDVKVGDEIVIIGKQEEMEIKVSSFSDISNELNYEILAHLPEKIKRKVIE